MDNVAIVATIIVQGILNLAGLVFGYLSLKEKLRHGVKTTEDTAALVAAVDEKVEANTKITKAGVQQTAIAKEAVQEVKNKLNGGVDSAVNNAIDPLKKALEDQAAKINDLERYVHQRNHETVNVLQAQGNKLELILKVLERMEKVEK